MPRSKAIVRRSLDDALSHHGVGNLQEASDVGASHVVALHAKLLGRVVARVIDATHDALETGVDLLEGPGDVASVLAHLETGGRHATGVGSLAREEGDAVVLQVLGRVKRGGHVGALAHDLAAVGDELLGILEEQGVLAGARKRDVAGDAPDAAAVLGMPLGVRAELGVHRKAHALVVAGALPVVDGLEGGHVDALRIIDPALGVGACNDLAAELLDLLDGVRGNIAGAMDDHGLALEGVIMALEVLVDVVDQAVAGSLGTGEGAAEGEALAGEDAGEGVGQTLVLTEHVRNLTAADAQVASGDVGILADVAVEFSNETLAEAHDLVVGLALGMEVGSTLSATHR